MGTIMQTGTSLLGMGGYLKPTGTSTGTSGTN
jgi:hypothetical protein